MPADEVPLELATGVWQRLVTAPSARAIDLALRHLGRQADVEISAHALRHTCLTRLVRAGNDIVLVAELAGHARLETTRRYSVPSDADRQAAMDALTVDY